jgi:hypothetical protein
MMRTEEVNFVLNMLFALIGKKLQYPDLWTSLICDRLGQRRRTVPKILYWCDTLFNALPYYGLKHRDRG